MTLAPSCTSTGQPRHFITLELNHSLNLILKLSSKNGGPCALSSTLVGEGAPAMMTPLPALTVHGGPWDQGPRPGESPYNGEEDGRSACPRPGWADLCGKTPWQSVLSPDQHLGRPCPCPPGEAGHLGMERLAQKPGRASRALAVGPRAWFWPSLSQCPCLRKGLPGRRWGLHVGRLIGTALSTVLGMEGPVPITPL